MRELKAYLGLGSNLGNRAENLSMAIEMISKVKGIEILRISKTYETSPAGYESQPDFLNCAIEIETSLSSSDLLKKLLEIETEMGRVRVIKWGPRSIDIDILFYSDNVVDTSELTIPHPEIQNRAFVLAPLNDLAPYLVHPVSKKNIEQLLEEIGSSGIKKVMDLEGFR
jgi:2-amino-4-hydroxy-6-hydroxymethyldihydropteridine diphosphokinase